VEIVCSRIESNGITEMTDKGFTLFRSNTLLEPFIMSMIYFLHCIRKFNWTIILFKTLESRISSGHPVTQFLAGVSLKLLVPDTLVCLTYELFFESGFFFGGLGGTGGGSISIGVRSGSGGSISIREGSGSGSTVGSGSTTGLGSTVGSGSTTGLGSTVGSGSTFIGISTGGGLTNMRGKKLYLECLAVRFLY
jgi:hypothetical protein